MRRPGLGAGTLTEGGVGPAPGKRSLTEGLVAPVGAVPGKSTLTSEDAATVMPLASAAASPAQQPAHSPVSTAVVPGGHTQGKVKVEFGSGSIKGSVVLTFAHGQVGVPLEPGELTALKSSASLKLNGFVHKLETALLNDQFDFDSGLDGVTVALEMSAMTVGSDGRSVDTDLLKIGVKLVGDVTHWLEAAPNIKLTIDGRISVDIGGKLAAKLGPFIARQVEQLALAKEIDEVGAAAERHTRAFRELDTKLKTTRGGLSPAAERKLRQEILEHELQVSTSKRQLRDLTRKLGEAKQRANTALRQMEGKLAKQVAKVMGKKAVKVVAKTLAKLVPILNLVSIAIDVVELVGVVKALLEGEFGGSGDGDGDDGEARDGAAHDGGSPAGAPDDGSGEPGGEGSGSDTQGQSQEMTTDPQGATPSKQADSERASARVRLSPEARIIVDALGRKSGQGGPGAQINADQLTTLGLLISNAGLTAAEVERVLALLRGSGTKAQSADDFVVALDTAVRQVRNRNSTMAVDGQRVATDADADTADQEGSSDSTDADAAEPVTTPREREQQRGETGPITSPKQVEGGSGSEDPKQLDTLAIVRGLPAAIVGRWFVANGDQLVLSTEGSEWQKANLKKRLGDGSTLARVENSIENQGGKRRWTLTITFVVQRGIREESLDHHFMVTKDGAYSGIGARVGNLLFENFVLFSP